MNVNLALIALLAVALGLGAFFVVQSMPANTELKDYIELMLEPQFDTDLSYEAQEQMLLKIGEIFHQRLAAAGIKGVQLEVNEVFDINVNIPLNIDPEEVKPLLLSKGQLSLHDVVQAGNAPNSTITPNSDSEMMLKDTEDVPYLILREPFLSEGILESAKIAMPDDRGFSAFRIELKFTEQAAQIFATHIIELAPNNHIALVADGTVLSAPMVTESFIGFARDRGAVDTAVIEGNFDEDGAQQLVLLLNTAPLPTEIILLSERLITSQEDE